MTQPMKPIPGTLRSCTAVGAGSGGSGSTPCCGSCSAAPLEPLQSLAWGHRFLALGLGLVVAVVGLLSLAPTPSQAQPPTAQTAPVERAPAQPQVAYHGP